MKDNGSRKKTRRLTTEEFIERARKIHGDKYDYSKVEYKNMHTKVCIICPIHGEFCMFAQIHLLGGNCPKCVKKHKYTTEEFIHQANEVHGKKFSYDKSEYVNRYTKLCIVCPIHGEFWITPEKHIGRAQGCPQCSHRSYKKTTDEFITESREIHGDKYNYSEVEYENQNTEVKIICPKHGVFFQTPKSHLKGRGCPKCKQSHLEETVLRILKNNDISVEPQKTFEWMKYNSKMFLDFYLPDYNIAIECQGEQHFYPIEIFGEKKVFQETQERDECKKMLCEENGVKLLYFSNLKYEEFLQEKIIHSTDELLKEINKR